MGKRPRPRTALGGAVLLAMMAIGMPSAAARAMTATATITTKTRPTTGTGAAAVCPGGFCTNQDIRLMRAQLPLDKAVTAIRQAVQAKGWSGYAGVTVNPARHRLDLYWHGALPGGTLRLLARLRGPAVRLHIHPAAYSKQQLDRAVARVLARSAGRLGERPTQVVELADGSGLEVDFARHVAATTVTAALTPGVRVITGTHPAAVPLSREADFPPYWAGALITTSLGSCTSGFGIHSIYNSSITYLLTARHCVHLPNDTVKTGAGVVIGPLGPDSPSLDLVVIDTNSGSSTYDGPAIYMSGQFSKPVVAQSGNAVGDMLCTSGAFSGARCNIRVIATGVYTGYGGPMVEAEQLSHQNAAGQGDSGGPVFSLAANPNQVIAKGIIDAGDPSAPATCTGQGGRQCFWRFTFVGIDSALTYYSANVNTP